MVIYDKYMDNLFSDIQTMASRTKSPVKGKTSRNEMNSSTANIAAKAKALKKAQSPEKEPDQGPPGDFIKCELCKHILEGPKTLSCMHSFCRNCLVTYTTEIKSSDPKTIVCPVCLQGTARPKTVKGNDENVDYLPTNDFLRNYLEAKRLRNPEKSCDTCRRQKRDTVAIMWCRMCHDALCEKCVGFHNALKSTKQHNLVDLKTVRNEPIEKSISSPFCKKHEGEVVTKYCENHKEVSCDKCVADDHKACKNVKTLKEAVENKKEAITHVNSTLNEEATLAKAIYDNRTTADKTIDTDENEILVKIQNVRKQINDNLTKCETQMITELHSIHSKEKATIQSEIKEAQRIRKSSKKVHGLAASTEKYGTDSHILQSLPDTTLQSIHYKERLGSLNGRIKNKKINFIVDSTLGNLMQGISRLGELRVSSSSAELPTSKALKALRNDSDPEDEVDIRGSRRTLNSDTKSMRSLKSLQSGRMYANLKEVFSAGSTSDKETCWFTGMTYMPNGNLIVVDRNNNKLKTIDSKFKLVSETPLDNQPFGITAISETEIAVTIPRENKIDIFNVGASIAYTKSLKISERGYGIAFATKTFAVACSCASPPSIKVSLCSAAKEPFTLI